jgi:hypothetical protein
MASINGRMTNGRRVREGLTAGRCVKSACLAGRTLLSVSYLSDSTGIRIAATDGRTWSVDTRTSAWVQRACRTAGRNLTQAEWKQYFPNMRYESTCPQWPPGT